MNRFVALHNAAVARIEALLSIDLIALATRFGIGAVFWYSGRTKVDASFHVTDAAIALFADEYRLPLVAPVVAAYAAAYAEHLFPLLLTLGLLTRASALALLGMTFVIEVFVYPDAWPTHLSWAALLLMLLRWGGGRLSLDRVFGLR